MTIFSQNELNQFQTDYLHTLKQSSEEEIEDVCSKISQETETENQKESILCKNCKNEITTMEYGITVNGQHTHIFKNPAGITFHIGCFSSAWGCFVYGVPTYDVTWFKGFSWCVALCAHCFSHLGWHYQSGGESFFGLILANLIKDFKLH